MILDEGFHKAKPLSKKKEVVILVAEAMVTRVVEEEELVIDKVQEKVIGYVLVVIERERPIAISEP
jgi:hypothetical protein